MKKAIPFIILLLGAIYYLTPIMQIFVGTPLRNHHILDCSVEENLTKKVLVSVSDDMEHIQELAKLSEAIYASRPNRFSLGIDEFCHGIKCDIEESVNGLRSLTAIDNSQSDLPEITVVFRGTGDDTKSGIDADDLSTDLEQHLGQMPPMYKDAIILVQNLKDEYPNAHITTTGHSLGGALANVAAQSTDTDAVLFNPATLNIYNYIESASTGYSGDMITFVNEGDQISGAKMILSPTRYQGELFILSESDKRSSGAKHSIAEIRARLNDISQTPNVVHKLCESYNGRSQFDI